MVRTGGGKTLLVRTFRVRTFTVVMTLPRLFKRLCGNIVDQKCPDRYIRRQRHTAHLNSLDASESSMQAQNISTILRSNETSPAAGRWTNHENLIDYAVAQALRSRHNRMLGEEINQMHGVGRSVFIAQGRQRQDLRYSLHEMDTDREQLLRLILVSGFEPPDRDMLELPDRNDF